MEYRLDIDDSLFQTVSLSDWAWKYEFKRVIERSLAGKRFEVGDIIVHSQQYNRDDVTAALRELRVITIPGQAPCTLVVDFDYNHDIKRGIWVVPLVRQPMWVGRVTEAIGPMVMVTMYGMDGKRLQRKAEPLYVAGLQRIRKPEFPIRREDYLYDPVTDDLGQTWGTRTYDYNISVIVEGKALALLPKGDDDPDANTFMALKVARPHWWERVF